MSFGELRKFIDDARKRLSDSDSDANLPRSKKEFVILSEMLHSKAEVLKGDAPASTTPSPEYPRFQPSEELSSLQRREEQLSEILHKAYEDESSTAQYVGLLERELSALEREIAELETRERAEYDKLLYPYWEARNAQSQSNRLRKEEAEKEATRAKIVRRVRQDIELAFKSEADASTSRLPWRNLPPGELSVEDVIRHYDRLSRQGVPVRFDQERLDKADLLGWEHRYLGIDEYEGYIIYTFAHTPKALMKCPIVGNAIYLIDSDWERLSRMSKQELLDHPSVTRIPHQGNWFEKVKEELGI